MSVQMAVSPMLFQMMNSPERYRFYSKYMTYFAFVTMFMVLGLSLFGREIIKVITIDRAYWESFRIMPLIGLAIFFSMLKDTSLLGLQIAKKSKIVSTVVVLMTLLNPGLNFVLTPVLGMYRSISYPPFLPRRSFLWSYTGLHKNIIPSLMRLAK